MIKRIKHPFAMLMLVSASLFHTPTQAKLFGTFAGWEVSADDVDYDCVVAREHEGPGDTVMGLNVELVSRDIYVFIVNANWTIKEKDTIEAGIGIDGVDKAYVGPAVGFMSDGKRGLVMKMVGEDHDFLANFARGSGIRFYRFDAGDKENKPHLIDYLNLDGTQAAADALGRCLSTQRARLNAAEAYKRRWKDIPADPFKK